MLGVVVKQLFRVVSARWIVGAHEAAAASEEHPNRIDTKYLLLPPPHSHQQ